MRRFLSALRSCFGKKHSRGDSPSGAANSVDETETEVETGAANNTLPPVPEDHPVVEAEVHADADPLTVDPVHSNEEHFPGSHLEDSVVEIEVLYNPDSPAVSPFHSNAELLTCSHLVDPTLYSVNPSTDTINLTPTAVIARLGSGAGKGSSEAQKKVAEEGPKPVDSTVDHLSHDSPNKTSVAARRRVKSEGDTSTQGNTRRSVVLGRRTPSLQEEEFNDISFHRGFWRLYKLCDNFYIENKDLSDRAKILLRQREYYYNSIHNGDATRLAALSGQLVNATNDLLHRMQRSSASRGPSTTPRESPALPSSEASSSSDGIPGPPNSEVGKPDPVSTDMSGTIVDEGTKERGRPPPKN